MYRTDPEAAAELMRAAGLEPLEPYVRAIEPWPCRCVTCGAQVSPSYNAVQQGKRCRVCAIRQRADGIRLDPAKAAEVMRANGAEPLDPYPGGNTLPWRCRCLRCGREITPRYNNVAKGRGPCRFCGVERGADARRMPEAEAVERLRAAGAEPSGPFPSRISLPWRSTCLRCGRSIKVRLSTVLGRGSDPCVYCSRTRIDEAEAVEVMRAAGAEPLEPYPGSKPKWRCRCLRCGREIEPSHMLVSKGVGACAYCGGVRVDPAEAEARMLAVGMRPLEPYPGKNDRRWRSQCLRCGTESAPSFATATSTRGKGGCPTCANAARADAQRIPADEAVEMIRAADVEPLEPYPGVLTKWRCRCNRCGREVTPLLTVVQQGGGACPRCADYGFDPTDPAIVYVITHPLWNAHKVGIAGIGRPGVKHPGRRLDTHRRDGWQVYKTLHFEHGADARHVEQAVLRQLRLDLGLGPHLTAGTGWTETVDADAISLPALWRLVINEQQRSTPRDTPLT